MEDGKKNSRIYWIYQAMMLLAFLFFACAVISSCVISKRQVSGAPKSYTDYEYGQLNDLLDGWILTREDGTTEEVSFPLEISAQENETIILKHNVKGLLKDGDVLYFYNQRYAITVKADDQIIQEVNTTYLRNTVHYKSYMIVQVPDAENVSEITLILSDPVNGRLDMREFYYGSCQNIRSIISMSELFSIVLLVMCLISVYINFIIGLFFVRKNISDLRFFDLTVFVLTAMLWGFCDSNLPVMTAIPQETTAVICYLSLAALPLPMGHFIWVSTGRKSKEILAVSVMAATKIIIDVCISFLGIMELQYTLYSSFAFAALMIIAGIYDIIRKGKEEPGNFENILVMIGSFCLALLTSAAIFEYLLMEQIYRGLFLLGVLLFNLFLCISVVYHFMMILRTQEVKLAELHIQQKLALHDVLTGLMNRRAYEKQMEELELRYDQVDDAVLIMMDMNGLKATNDRYGHAAGDNLIVSVSEIIRSVYGDIGSVYRVGGDEFAVILENLIVPTTELKRRFMEKINRWNEQSQSNISIATGAVHLRRTNGKKRSLREWKQEADMEMYRNKASAAGKFTRSHAEDFKEIVECMITTMDARDPYTRNHSERVGELSRYIGEKLGLSDITLEYLEVAAYMHDIGKIGIPDSILLKPERLTEEEYAVIKKHSEIGAAIIRNAKGMQEIADIVLYHHEAYDGSGYPEGLSGMDIPIESRIIAVADSIDAMTSRRSYREAISPEQCRQEIEKNIGHMYDPAIAEIVLENWDEVSAKIR